MATMGHWRGLCAALGLAVAAGCFLLGGGLPAQAIPCSCPAGYTVNNAAPLHPFCFSAALTPHQLACGSLFGGTAASKIAAFKAIAANNGAGGFNRFEGVGYTGPHAGDVATDNNFYNEGDQLVKQVDQLLSNPNPLGLPGLTPAPSHLGMYVSSSPTGGIDAFAAGGGSVTRSSGYGVTDSAGLLAPGTTTPSIRDVSGGGGIAGSYKVSGLPANQSLSFSGFFDYARDNITLGTITGLAAGNAGSGQTDTYTFGGSFLYSIGATYLRGSAAYDFGHGSESLNLDGSAGSFSTHGYSADLKLGHVFVLLNTISSGNPAMPTKAPPKLAGGYVVALDLSGHLGYSNQQVDGFTDSSGFVFGTDQTQYGDIGGRAKLFALVPNNGLVWMPYIAGTVDQGFGFSSTLNIPTQAALVGGDVLGLQEALTFWGTEFGIDVRGPNGWTVGAKGFYSASADTNITGGTAYVKIPLNYTPRPVFAPRY